MDSELNRKFRLILFEWDETIVENEFSKFIQLVVYLEQLLLHGVICVIVTHTNFDTINRQFCSHISNSSKINLYICANRDSEVFGFLDTGKEIVLYQKTASQQENLSFSYVARKPIEIGLTHKSNSFRWIDQNIIIPKAIPLHEAVTFGDGFGSIGLNQFLSFLEHQLMMGKSNSSMIGEYLQSHDPSWLIEQEGFSPTMERELEPIFSLGNGYIGVRGSSSLSLPISQSDLYVAGIYDQKAPGLPYSESQFLTKNRRMDPYTEIVPFPSPFSLILKIDGKECLPEVSRVLEHKRILDMKNGILYEKFKLKTENNDIIDFKTSRCVSLSDPHLLLHDISISAIKGGATVEVDKDLNYQEFVIKFPHLERVKMEEEILPMEKHISYYTRTSRFKVDFWERIFIDGEKSIEFPIHISLENKNQINIKRLIYVHSSRDNLEDLKESIKAFRMLTIGDFDKEIIHSLMEFNKYWYHSDIQFEDNPSLTQSQRFNLYHLRIAADHCPWTSIGARALTGRAYEGHVFWDADIFIMPVYLYNFPKIAKDLILYRYETLNGAKKRAVDMGFRGACYAWESTVTGADVTPTKISLKRMDNHQVDREVPVYTGMQQIHITADVAYSIWRYWDATLDHELISIVGAEILIETARFWASRVQPLGGELHILGVVGPDEYHYNVNDNAFTNWMAKFNLEKAVWVVEWMEAQGGVLWDRLSRKLEFNPTELENWKKTARELYIPKPNENGIIEQFSGFFSLEEIELPKEELFKTPVHRLFEWERISKMKLIKQADVLMIFYLFPDSFPQEIVRANYLYYKKYTDHGSSLSPAVYAGVAADIGFYKEAIYFWERSIGLDLLNIMGNTALGIHLGCMGGAWQSLLFHILNLRFTDSNPFIHAPSTRCLPDGASAVRFNLIYRGKSYSFEVGNLES